MLVQLTKVVNGEARPWAVNPRHVAWVEPRRGDVGGGTSVAIVTGDGELTFHVREAFADVLSAIALVQSARRMAS